MAFLQPYQRDTVSKAEELRLERLEVTFKNYRPAELVAVLPFVERVDAHTVRFTGKDIFEVARFLGFLMNYRPDLTP